MWARQGCRALRQCCAAPRHARCGTFQSTASAVTTLLHVSLFHLTLTKGRRPPPADGVGTAALGLTPRGLRHLRMALWDDWGFRPLRRAGFRAVRGAGVSLAAASGEFRPLRRATRGSASGLRDLGCPPPVGKSGRRGIFRQSKVWVRSHTGCMARNRTAAMAEKARRAPQTHGRWVALTRKNRVKSFYSVVASWASQQDVSRFQNSV